MSSSRLDAVFAPVRSQTAFEETMERICTAIKLGLLEPGARLPPERKLCARLGISRSTLREALSALVQSGYIHTTRGRGGGTFVVDEPPPVDPPSAELMAAWRETCDVRLAIELGVVTLACDRLADEQLAVLAAAVEEMAAQLDDFAAYRQADVRFHIGLAEMSGNGRLVALATEIQGSMTDLIAHIAHPPEVLSRANDQHARLLKAVRAANTQRAVGVMTEHVRGTEHVLAGLLPDLGPPGH
ncbi:MAG TPA: FCD domain-containing protein [Solirubrobacteraceae bacterium]|nr:FCD domain-containing protein [Solirubrobacteraceae bacterium]